jgi:hypothetical protein
MVRHTAGKGKHAEQTPLFAAQAMLEQPRVMTVELGMSPPLWTLLRRARQRRR